TGVQTCALPILRLREQSVAAGPGGGALGIVQRFVRAARGRRGRPGRASRSGPRLSLWTPPEGAPGNEPQPDVRGLRPGRAAFPAAGLVGRAGSRPGILAQSRPSM